MEALIHSLAELAHEGNVPALQAALVNLSPSDRQACFQILPGQVSVLGASVSMLEDIGPEASVFLVDQGAADDLPPREVNALYHRLYAKLAKPVDEATPAAVEAVLESLWSRGVGKSIRGECWSPAHIAAALPDGQRAVSHLGKLQGAGFGLDHPDEIGETPLMVAAWRSPAATLACLLDAGASMDARTAGGKDVVHYVFQGVCDTETEPVIVATIDKLRQLHARGYPVDAAMASHRARSAHVQSRIEAEVLHDVLQHAAPPISQKRNGPRL